MTKKIINIKTIESLVHQGESDTLEFKKSTAELHSAAKTICGFLNQKGGYVLIGVTDNKKIIGQDVSEQTRHEITNLIKKFEPSPLIDIDYVQIANSSRQIIALRAYHDEYATPYTFDGKPFSRLQSQTSPMPRELYHRLLLDKTQKNKGWEDGVLEEITLDDLDHDEIIKTIQTGVASGRIPPTKETTDPFEALTRLQLVRNNHFINAAVVLFAKDPTYWLPQCRLRLARFLGKDKRNAIDNRQIEGNAFRLLDEGLMFIQRHLPISSYFKQGEIERIDEPLIPVDALRELFVNAICHRDYRSPGGSISCAIYDDHLEIWNEGTLPDGFGYEELKSLHDSRPRNPHIAKVFYCRKLFESWGSGIELITNLCRQTGNPDPDFFERSGGFCVRLSFKQSLNPAKSEVITATPLTYKLNLRQKEILKLLEKEILQSASELHSSLSKVVTLRTVTNDLSLLAKYSLIESVGHGRATKWKPLKS
ncbi:MAG TPA: RNA-binding domain-containing protein [Chthoniobacterales bacterium]|nr:RNA-binding domain-containing protein [Chthoniobacterales bacterium]